MRRKKPKKKKRKIVNRPFNDDITAFLDEVSLLKGKPVEVLAVDFGGYSDGLVRLEFHRTPADDPRRAVPAEWWAVSTRHRHPNIRRTYKTWTGARKYAKKLLLGD